MISKYRENLHLCAHKFRGDSYFGRGTRGRRGK